MLIPDGTTLGLVFWHHKRERTRRARKIVREQRPPHVYVRVVPAGAVELQLLTTAGVGRSDRHLNGGIRLAPRGTGTKAHATAGCWRRELCRCGSLFHSC